MIKANYQRWKQIWFRPDNKNACEAQAFILLPKSKRLIIHQGSYVALQNGLGGVIYATLSLQSDGYVHG